MEECRFCKRDQINEQEGACIQCIETKEIIKQCILGIDLIRTDKENPSYDDILANIYKEVTEGIRPLNNKEELPAWIEPNGNSPY